MTPAERDAMIEPLTTYNLEIDGNGETPPPAVGSVLTITLPDGDVHRINVGSVHTVAVGRSVHHKITGCPVNKRVKP